MMIRPLLAVAVCLVVLPATAKADWQYTKWGMTQSQVISASNGAAGLRSVKGADGIEKREVGGTYTAGGRSYDASFSFDNEKLSLVSLTLANANNCGHILADLKSLYGEPMDESGGMFPQWSWDDRKKGNRIVATGLLGDCLLQYKPLPAAKDTGL